MKNTTKYIYFYIDGINGNDGNPGTFSSPFKTLDRAFSQYENYEEIRFHFIGKCKEYSTEILTFNSIGMHLKNLSSVSPIKIKFPKKCAFYNSHINVNSIDDPTKMIEINIDEKLYNDGGSLIFKNSIISGGEYCNYGGSVVFETCTFKNSGNMCRVDNAGTTMIKGATFTSSNKENVAIKVDRGKFTAQGYCKINGEYKYVISGTLSDLIISCALNSTCKNAQLISCNIFSTQARYDTWFSKARINQCYKAIQK